MARYRTVRRTVLTLAVSAGFIAAAAVPASAMTGISLNHSQPLSDLG